MELKTKQVFLYGCSFVFLGACVGVIGPTLHGLSEHSSTDVPSLGILLTVRGLGGLATSFVAGYLMEKLPGHMLLCLILSATVLSMFLVPEMSSLTSLIASFAIMGMSFGGLATLTNGLCIWADPENSGLNLNLINGAFGIGTSLSPFLAMFSEHVSGDVNLSYQLIAAFGIGLITLFACIESPKSVSSEENKPLLSNKISPAAPSTPVSSPADPSIVKEEIEQTEDDASLIEPTFGMLALAALSILLAVGTECTLGSWLYTYAVSIGMSGKKADLITAAYWISFTCSRFAIAAVLKFVSTKTIYIVELFMCLAVMLLWVIFPHSPLVLWITAMSFGIGISGCFANCIAIAGTYFRITGRINGIISFGASAGDMTLPLVISFLMGKNNSWMGPIAIVYSMIAMVILMIGAAVAFAYICDREVESQRKTKKTGCCNV